MGFDIAFAEESVKKHGTVQSALEALLAGNGKILSLSQFSCCYTDHAIIILVIVSSCSLLTAQMESILWSISRIDFVSLSLYDESRCDMLLYSSPNCTMMEATIIPWSTITFIKNRDWLNLDRFKTAAALQHYFLAFLLFINLFFVLQVLLINF